jgi:hypothetical protein
MDRRGSSVYRLSVPGKKGRTFAGPAFFIWKMIRYPFASLFRPLTPVEYINLFNPDVKFHSVAGVEHLNISNQDVKSR